MSATLHTGDARTVLPTLPDNSVHAIITDPPYEIGIANHTWDSTKIAFDTDMWAQCLRILKPGGHLLAFGHVRTYHRTACAVEDAGFQIRDQIDWIYTHGKPKSTDVSRAIDRRRDDRTQILQVTAWLAAARDAAGWTNRRIDALWGYNGMAGQWTTQGVAANVPTMEQWTRLRAEIGFDDTDILPVVTALNARKHTVGDAWKQREIISRHTEAPRRTGLYPGYSGLRITSRPASADARQWEGWHTALRPAHDPILLARKSPGYGGLTGTVLRHGTGGLHTAVCSPAGGGWPTNVVLGHDCDGPCRPGCPVRDLGAAGASFPVFRVAGRTPATERVEVDGVRHDTPKPLALMRWLVRLVTPPGGTVLDPFAGSGTTLVAAVEEGASAVGVEAHPPYAEIARARLAGPLQPSLGLDATGGAR